MNNILNNIRVPNKEIYLKRKIINTILILLLGILLGILSKWLDNLSIDDTIWYQHIIGVLDLRNILSEYAIWIFIAITISVFSNSPSRARLNVLLFFIGMTSSYHIYTILFSGFNPKNYMMIWYTITLLSPLLAYICWYAKGDNKVSIIISSFILSVMFILCFNIGIWYFDIKSIIDLTIFISTLLVLYITPKTSIYSLLIAIIISIMFEIIIWL